MTIRNEIQHTAHAIWLDACKRYNLRGPLSKMPPSQFNLTGGNAGMVRFYSDERMRRGKYRNPHNLSFRWNMALAQQVGIDEYRKTIAHEVAHAVRLLLRGDATHGPEWARVCRDLGGTGNRTHTHGVAQTHDKRKPVSCGCPGGQKMGPVQYRRMLAGRKYACSICGEHVRPL